MSGNQRGGATAGPTSPTPIPISSRLRALLVAAGCLGLLLLTRAAPGALRLLLGGGTLALLLAAPVRLLSRALPRPLAILLAFLALALLAALAALLLIPPLLDQLAALADATPRFAGAAQRALAGLLRQLQDRGLMPGDPDALAARARRTVLDRAQAQGAAALGALIGAVSAAAGALLEGLALLLVAVYLLADIHRFEDAFLGVVPARYRPDARELWTTLGRTLSRYLGGVAFMLVERGTLVALGLWLLGVPAPVALGVWSGLTGLLPYLGAWLGALPVVLVALTVSPATAALAALLCLALNEINGNLVEPRVLGRALAVHPLLLLLAVVAGGELAGAAGAILALPAVAVLRVLYAFFRARLYVRPTAPPVAVTIPEVPEVAMATPAVAAPNGTTRPRASEV